MSKDEIRTKIPRGGRVAVAVGSRGIRNLSVIVKTVLECIEASGGLPFIVPAMGSHGGGTEEGQRKVLAGYGITEEAMGVPVASGMDVIHLGKTHGGVDVFFDKVAFEADLIVPINRIKPHTDFVADVQSGLCKMLVVGIGNHIGCSAVHEEDFDVFGDIILDAANVIIGKTNVGFGVAVVENAYDETALIEAVPSEILVKREKELLKVACANMPALLIPDIDVLIVQEIGKNISGAGFDPNILGKSYNLKEFACPVPTIGRMVLLDISEKSQGNALGMGVFDVITQRVFDKLDLTSIYANAIASRCIEDARIPLIAKDDEMAQRIAVKVARGADIENLKIVKIKNTLELETIEVSEALLSCVYADERLNMQS
jgi:hypothetical protein